MKIYCDYDKYVEFEKDVRKEYKDKGSTKSFDSYLKDKLIDLILTITHPKQKDSIDKEKIKGNFRQIEELINAYKKSDNFKNEMLKDAKSLRDAINRTINPKKDLNWTSEI